MNGFWSEYQPGFRFTDFAPGSIDFYREVERERYALEPHIPSLARFDERQGWNVLEVGCGVATDGVQFARAGAIYTGVDASSRAIELAERRFALEGAEGRFLQAEAACLPFPDETFDLVYSHGVIHHFAETAEAVAEFHRVLRPGGEAVVMVYHRSSLNYHLNIMTIRRVLAPFVLVRPIASVVARITGEDADVVLAHRRLFAEHGVRYLSDRSLFLSNNTDGPGNPLSKVYTRAEIAALFSVFGRVTTDVRFLNLRLWPGGGVLSHTSIGRHLERRVGWHLWVTAVK